MKKVMYILLGSIFVLTGCFSKTPVETPNKNETTVVVEESTVVQTTVQIPDTEMVTLNTGVVISLGDEIEMQNPNYYEGTCSYFGVVKSMYPETGRVLLRTKGRVVEFNYRQVIDIQGSEETCGYDGPAETKQINQQLRGVVYLDDQGEEHVHFIRALDGESAARGIQITDMIAYEPLKYYEMLWDDSNIPQEIIDFYNSI